MTKAKSKVADTTDEIEAVKGFDRNMQCRGYRFAVGETYTHTGKVDVCNAGFHSIEGNPLDAWSYYGPATSKYAVVKASGAVSRQTKGDSKIASATLRIEATLLLPDFIKRAAAWVVAHATGNIGTGCSGHAAATGNSGHAAATGDMGHAAATGDMGHAAATGDMGHAAATGYIGHAAATGDMGHAAATGYSGHAAATGNSGHAAATGYSGHAAATGDRGHAAATGDCGHAAATGDRGHAAATGDRGHAAATGYIGHAAATGDRGHAAATGDRGHAAATGYIGHAAATGDRGVAVSLGFNGTAMAGATGWIVLAYCSPNYPYAVERVERFKVGDDGVEAGKAYRLNAAGKPVEVAA